VLSTWRMKIDYAYPIPTLERDRALLAIQPWPEEQAMSAGDALADGIRSQATWTTQSCRAWNGRAHDQQHCRNNLRPLGAP